MKEAIWEESSPLCGSDSPVYLEFRHKCMWDKSIFKEILQIKLLFINQTEMIKVQFCWRKGVFSLLHQIFYSTF